MEKGFSSLNVCKEAENMRNSKMKKRWQMKCLPQIKDRGIRVKPQVEHGRGSDWTQLAASWDPTIYHSILNIAYGNLQVTHFILQVGVFLGHFLILCLPLVTRGFQGLHLTLVVAGFNVRLAEPVTRLVFITLRVSFSRSVLLDSLAHRLIGFFSLLFEQLKASL
jgi:hypothetical protein